MQTPLEFSPIRLIEEAKKLYKEAGKSQMVGDCEEIIKKLKKQV